MANVHQRFAVRLGILLIAVILGGCSTPESRIEKDPALYSSFPSDVQTSIKQGKIGMGFTPAMVEMAWGQPGAKREVVDDKGKRDVWIYFSTRQVFDGYDMVQIPRPGANGQPGGVYIEQRPRFRTENYERATVTFTGGKVSKIVQ